MSHDGEPGEGGASIQPDDSIAERYRVVKWLGERTFGEVWEAHDAITQRPVAIKLLRANIELGPAHAQLEVAVLRQRLPGVVELKDDGIHEGRAFLVMELIDGLPFPGKSGACSWDEIAGATVGLLETLARVHEAFLVHRDLKPENVLVSPSGQVRLLDFGIAYQQAAGSIDPTIDTSHVAGTPLYMAPEQFQARAITERTDLYALGIMLYQALAGAKPFDDKHAGLLFVAKVNKPPPPLREVAPLVPEAVARLVDRMLAIAPADRPRSAFEVLAELRGERSVEDPLFPWVGPQTTIAVVLTAAREGRSIDIVGPRGSGRTRHLLAVEQTLSPQRRMVWIKPAERALESLAELFGADGPAASLDLTEAVAVAEQQVRRALAAGAVLLVDDASRLDPCSAEVLARVRGSGVVIRALEEPDGSDVPTVRLRPLGEVELRSLFAGPDRLLHLREDSAKILFQRTEGMPARVVRELTTWMDLGIARWVRNLVVVSRAALDRLAFGLLAGAPAAADASVLRELSPEQADLLVWISLAWPHTTVPLLASLMDEPRFRLDALVETLVARGLVRDLPDGQLAPQVPAPIASWPEERVRRAHAAIATALAPGVAGRLLHLVAAGAPTDKERRALSREAAALAVRLIDEGHLGEAVTAIETGLRAARALSGPDEDEVCALLGLWVEAAFEDETPQALDRVLYALCRRQPRTPLVAHLERLIRAIAAEDFRGRALALLADVPPFEDVRLERVRLGAFATAARKLADEGMEARLLAEIARSPAAADDEIAARLDHWRGRMLYVKGEFRESARLHAAAARRSTSVPMRIFAMTSGAYSLLEAFDLDEAHTLAERARALSARHRHVSHEVIAELTLRTIAYRNGTADAADNELAQAIGYAAGRWAHGAVLFNEAAIAWRAGRAVEALSFARKGHGMLSQIQARRGALLLRAFLVALGDPIDPSEAFELCEQARSSPVPGIGIQVLALLSIGRKLPPGVIDGPGILHLAGLVPATNWKDRCDILSVDECLEAMRGAPGERLLRDAPGLHVDG